LERRKEWSHCRSGQKPSPSDSVEGGIDEAEADLLESAEMWVFTRIALVIETHSKELEINHHWLSSHNLRQVLFIMRLAMHFT